MDTRYLKKQGFTFLSSLVNNKKVFKLTLFVIALIVLWFVLAISSRSYLETIPTTGGSMDIGLVGKPRFVNPVLAFSQTDKDLTQLVFSGLFKKNAEGEVVPDLAESYTVSEDRETYTVTIRDNAVFHDGEPVTAADVLFTISLIQDPQIQSPLQARWIGVQATAVDEKTVQFQLDTAYDFFLQNATIGILPRHQWESVVTEEIPFSLLNIRPVGAGPYKFETLVRDNNQSIQSYDLLAFENYLPHEPYISEIHVKLFDDYPSAYSALRNENIDSLSSLSPEFAYEEELDQNLYPIPFSRVFGLFFGPDEDKPALREDEVRLAIETAIDRQEIIATIFNNFAQSADSPVSTFSPWYVPQEADDVTVPSTEEASRILESNGWIKDELGLYTKNLGGSESTLEFTLHVPESEEMIRVAEYLKAQLAEAGIGIQIIALPISELNLDVIRRRDYQLLLFGLVSGYNPDLYSFWHSSGRLDPGINITQYTNSQVDDNLEDIRRGSTSSENISEWYARIQNTLRSERPAIFIYSPDLIFTLPASVQGVTLRHLDDEEQRFSSISDWYIQTEKILPLFNK